MVSQKPLIIIGAGAAANELLSHLGDVPEADRNWHFSGFIDDKVTESIEGKILGTIKEHSVNPAALYLCAIADPASKLKICKKLQDEGAIFTTFAHPTARVDKGVNLGAGSIICPFVYVGIHAEIGEHCFVNMHASINHNVMLGEGCTISCHADLTGYVNAGKGVFLGSHASILQNVKIGDFAVVGACCLVLKDVPAGKTVVGVPAKVLNHTRA